jgi:mRNA interferase RelE/StbE
MTYKLDLTKDALKFIEKLEPKHFKQVVNKVLSLLENPQPNDSKKLIGYDDYFRVSVGEYRVIYRIDKEEIVKIALIGKRNDDEVYKQFQRKMK